MTDSKQNKVSKIKWEYRRERSNNLVHLNDLGDEGWEIIAPENGNSVLMKRPKD